MYLSQGVLGSRDFPERWFRGNRFVLLIMRAGHGTYLFGATGFQYSCERAKTCNAGLEQIKTNKGYKPEPTHFCQIELAVEMSKRQTDQYKNASYTHCHSLCVQNSYPLIIEFEINDLVDLDFVHTGGKIHHLFFGG